MAQRLHAGEIQEGAQAAEVVLEYGEDKQSAPVNDADLRSEWIQLRVDLPLCPLPVHVLHLVDLSEALDCDVGKEQLCKPEYDWHDQEHDLLG